MADISFQKIYRFYGLKHHQVEKMLDDVTLCEDIQLTECHDMAGILAEFAKLLLEEADLDNRGGVVFQIELPSKCLSATVISKFKPSTCSILVVEPAWL